MEETKTTNVALSVNVDDKTKGTFSILTDGEKAPEESIVYKVTGNSNNPTVKKILAAAEQDINNKEVDQNAGYSKRSRRYKKNSKKSKKSKKRRGSRKKY